mmetsp:Transcript_158287/g.280597  ORF Transcript_158287/g.280597 Transcript_158287/m.280597 type:complete len:100 (+) Transcript_158287:504-803(+)
MQTGLAWHQHEARMTRSGTKAQQLCTNSGSLRIWCQQVVSICNMCFNVIVTMPGHGNSMFVQRNSSTGTTPRTTTAPALAAEIEDRSCTLSTMASPVRR